MSDTSVVRAMRILELLAHTEKPVPLKDLAAALDIPKSTAHGILRDLVQERFVDLKEPAAYTIGLKAFEVGSAHLRVAGFSGVVASELGRLCRALDLTAHYAVLDGTDAVYLYKQDPPGLGVQLASSVGARLPSHLTAVGKSCLAWLEVATVADHVVFAGAADSSRGPEADALACELARVRERGYSTDHGQVALGIECVAAPVFDACGPRGALGVSYLHGASSQVDDVAGAVRESAARLTSMLGGTVR
ncbi:IclR family transcriptional regulator [Streptomyces sp. NPDC056352]|uniref:IclR family transcriptional regulator n=1 Tax=Streptomyces sp. NPDC056352 TaxID=3345791 RepID=UPI0035E1E740